YLIRRSLGSDANEIVTVEGDTVKVRPAAVAVDAVEFERLATATSAKSLQEAAALYRGELLEGMDVDAAGFEEWLRQERQRLYELAVESCGRLLGCELRAGRHDAALQTAVRLLNLDPAQEAVQRTLMRLYEHQGRRAAALRQYQICVDVLRRELGAEPEEETTELYLHLLQGRPATPEAESAGPDPTAAGRRLATPSRALAEIPLVGRAAEMAILVAALDAACGGQG